MPQRYPVRFFLRDGTATWHERVDAAFAGHDLADRDSYGAFLIAHARAVLPLEAALDGAALWAEWQPRGDLLRADLGTLGLDVPTAMDVEPGSAAARWGLLYVLEGSRLGGAMLARQVGAGLPVAYLAAAHRDGSWGRFGDAIEAAAGDADWRAAALDGAIRGFGLFERAVRSAGLWSCPDGEVEEGVVGAAGIEPATPPV